ncbi:MAG: hypothetical protein K6E38_00980 [Fretibacterium sp.]|nr:hypothetical protein [Fretibacterium sp.]
MRRHRGLALTELLLGTFLASALGLLLITWEGEVLRVFNRSSAWLLAFQRGRRVLAFIESRALHTGLGLFACREEEALRRAFARRLSGGPSIPRLLTVYQDKPILMTPVTEKDGAFRGTALGLLHAHPSGVMVKRMGAPSAVPEGKALFSVLSGDRTVSLSRAGFRTGDRTDLTSWCALPLAGMPFYIHSLSGKTLSLSLASTVEAPVAVPLINELYCLRYEQFCVLNGNLVFRGMTREWSPCYPREEGVLALWVEWRPKIRVLDLWVLTTGGPAFQGRTNRPEEWPEDAPWEEDFSRRTLCVSRASWRLENT